MKKEDLCIDSKVRSEGAHPFYGALSRQGLDPLKLAYNPCWLDIRLKLTATAYIRCATSSPSLSGSIATWNSPFIFQQWPKPRPVLISPARSGWPGWVCLSGLDKYREFNVVQLCCCDQWCYRCIIPATFCAGLLYKCPAQHLVGIYFFAGQCNELLIRWLYVWADGFRHSYSPTSADEKAVAVAKRGTLLFDKIMCFHFIRFYTTFSDWLP